MLEINDRIADAAPDNWVDRHAPRWFRPYARLARYDRPIGYWLLFWPCAWGSAIATAETGGSGIIWVHLILFLIGAIAMRGAGCTYNDIVDRDLDKKVTRTRQRPLASGAISLKAGVAWLVIQCLVGLCVLLLFNPFTIALGAGALIPVAIYPFMKRITWWPQLFLGFSFGWGALIGYSALTASLSPVNLVLYLAAIFWIIGYDTIYAHQDREDDALIGVRSTARRFEQDPKRFLAIMYTGTIVLLVASFALAGVALPAYAGLAAFSLFLGWQVSSLDISDPAKCLRQFKQNGWAGALPVLGLMLVIYL